MEPAALAGGEPFRADLVSVAAMSTTNAWAVGSGGRVPLIEHWDGSFGGTSCQVIPSDNPPAANGLLESVAGTATPGC